MYVLNPYSGVGAAEFSGWGYWIVIVISVTVQLITLVIYEFTFFIGFMEILTGVVFTLVDIGGIVFTQAGSVSERTTDNKVRRSLLKQAFTWQFIMSWAGMAIIHFNLFWRFLGVLLGPNGEEDLIMFIAAGMVFVMVGGLLTVVAIIHRIYAYNESQNYKDYERKHAAKKPMYAEPTNGKRAYDDGWN